MVYVQKVKCPKCENQDIWKHGFHCSNGERKQKYKCKTCGYVWKDD